MSASTSSRSNRRASLWQRFKSLLIADVPEDIAICEFDCARSQCTHGEWETCERRIAIESLCRSQPADPAPDATDARASRQA